MEELVRQPLNWETVLDRSWWHRIRPLTYRHLRAQPDGTVPDHVLLELAGHASELSIRNRRLAKALADVAGMFEDAKLRGLVFKGPTLAEDAYGDLQFARMRGLGPAGEPGRTSPRSRQCSGRTGSNPGGIANKATDRSLPVSSNGVTRRWTCIGTWRPIG